MELTIIETELLTNHIFLIKLNPKVCWKHYVH